MTAKIGFIGTGKMASAIIKGIVSAGLYTTDEIIASNIHADSRAKAEKELGIKVYSEPEELSSRCELIVLAVKPQQIPSVFTSGSCGMGRNHTLVSIAAGITIKSLKTYVPDSKVLRVMPNICSTISAGASAISASEDCDENDLENVKKIFDSIGISFVIKEKDMDAVSAVSGSSPAFLFMIIEAMADGGVLMGLPRDMSIKLAAQTMYGAAKTVLETGTHPAILKDSVCSPGGTTIEGVKVLEDYGVRAAVISAIQASAEKSKELGKGN
ncbi:MAG: pyrroline-5-carboxylate reductase [Candidatus Methanomethylophilaceae archaeon]|nr:pyrroline-5-carboxylate reductase [Candidatus Methanomethylophilaceae archaeon]